MFESNIIRFLLLPLYGLATAGVIYLIWNNSAATDASKNIGIILASLLTVSVAILPYINSQTTEENFSYNLIYDSLTKRIITGDNLSNPYSCAYLPVFTNLTPNFTVMENIQNLMNDHGLNLIEKGILEEMMLHFQAHWDITYIQFATPLSNYTSGKISKLDSKTITPTQVKKIFTQNIIIKTPGILLETNMQLPPNSTLSEKQSEKTRQINIENKMAKVDIEISPIMLTVAQQGVTGILASDPKNLNRYYVASYQVLLKIKPQRFKQFSPEMVSYKKWFRNISNILREMDWKNIQEKIDKNLITEAATKVLNK